MDNEQSCNKQANQTDFHELVQQDKENEGGGGMP